LEAAATAGAAFSVRCALPTADDQTVLHVLIFGDRIAKSVTKAGTGNKGRRTDGKITLVC